MNIMKHRKKIIAIGSVLIVAVLAVVGYSVFGARSGLGAGSFVVAPTDLTELVKTTGKVKAADEVDLAFERGGRVVAVPVAVGETVKRGTPLAALDASDAMAASEQAAAALSSAQIALEKMKRPPEALDLMEANDAVSAASDAKDKAATDLAKSYDNAASASASALLDMRTVVPGLKDILHSNDLNAGQDNIDYYADTARVYDASADAYRLAAEDSFQAAQTSFDNAAADLNASGSTPDAALIKKLVAGSYDAAKLVADAAKAAGDLVNLYIGKLTEKQIAVPPIASAASATVAGYVAKMNNDFSALSAASSAITSFEDASTASARALSEKQEALAKLQAGAEDIDIRAQQTRVDEARAAANEANGELAKTALYAPFDGTVSQVNISVGELAGAGAPAVSLLSNAHYEIDAFVSEADIAKVAVGSKATETLDTFGSGENFDAVVTEVDPAETIVNGIGAYGIKLQFVHDDSRIKSGMTANIFITTGVRKAVLALPASAIITSGSDKFVFVDNGSSKPVKTPVTVGITGDDGRVEIVSGLKAGDKVVTYGSN